LKRSRKRSSGTRPTWAPRSAALALCRQRKAVLLIARLDRLSRSLTFVAQLLDANVEIKAADMPEANRMLLQMLAVFAEHERGLISQRTKAALAAAKARGVKLGKHGATLAAEHQAQAIAYAQTVRTSIDDARRDGATTTRALARWMNDHGVPSRSGGMWHAASVNRLLGRLR
jgi:DNA invertase Pin-like site-specific DNA recombinase